MRVIQSPFHGLDEYPFHRPKAVFERSLRPDVGDLVTLSFALIHNPMSRRNEGDGQEFRRRAAELLGDRLVCPSSRERLYIDVAALCREDIGCIVVDGGDGTVSDVMTAIQAARPTGPFPDIAILPSGNTNLIAADVGFGMRGIEAIERLIERDKAGTLRDGCNVRHPIILSWPETDRRPVLGMFCGLAAFTRATRLAHQPDVLNRYSHGMAVAVTIFLALCRLLSGKGRREWLGGTELTMSRDGGPEDSGGRFLFLCTTLHHLPYNLWPFWSGEADGGALIWLEVLSRPRSLISSVFSLLTGRVPASLKNNPSFRSGKSASFVMHMQEGLVMDGHEYDTGPNGYLKLTEGRAVAFLRA
ncbi:MAG: acylglycerol kinase family protein [Acetobacter sp.]|jgi:hypothetical protein|nr:acylglycerol kinase family protein [Acetobacter sp.]MCI1374650.1 acylglycerol kinase family protein [Acetobacter sp.]MCI1443004.1 acylglycerol kinase family protein [Acetobacter sp.]MCI1517407.1 acylglycerol kinase family protein [Acetobacter sp.]MCI1703240.1 acylglycerol kinase family protein [Acetobacter sp.]